MSPKFFLYALALSVSLRARATTPSAQLVPAPAAPPICSALTDGFCDQLWDQNHHGNIKVFDGEVDLGQSLKSDESKLVLMDLRALAESGARLPEDLRARALPILAKLKGLLDEEAKAGTWTGAQRFDWQDRLQMMRDEFASLKKRVQFERLLKASPAIANKSDDELTEPDVIARANVNRDLSNQIVDAKYAQHPNWLRVVNLFEEVRKQLLIEADKLPVNAEQKQFILNQYRTVKLSLPYPDPRRTASDADCASTTLNAFYDPNRHVYTVCAGWFNANQSKTALYQVTAHEMSHSVDNGSTSTFFYRTKSALAQQMSKLVGMKDKPVFACDEWAKIKADAAAFTAPPPQTYNSLEKLYRCLAPKELAEYDTAQVQIAMEAGARSSIGSYADSSYFLKLTEPTFRKKGGLEKNEFFQRPDIIFENANGFHFYKGYLRDDSVEEDFTQDLICEAQAAGKDLLTATDAERGELLKTAALTALSLTTAEFVDQMSYCGKNCDSLMATGMSAAPNEAFADWMAGKVVSNYLANLKGTLEQKRAASSVVMAAFCEAPGPEHDSPIAAGIQKKFSLEPHPENRVRRLSIYTPATSALLQCEIKTGEEGFGSCVP